MSPLPATKVRGFELRVVRRVGEVFSVALYETNGSPAHAPALVAELDARRTARAMPAILDALRASGRPPGVLSVDRLKPIGLDEAAGVRLALAMLATGPVAKPARAADMLAAVGGLTTEEAYYWYAKCVGPEAARMRRALRVFLAEE